jgi:hypothetical protein
MIETIATIDILDLALDQIDDGKVDSAKDTLITYRDKLQKEVDEFDKWAETQSNIHTSLDFEKNSKENIFPLDLEKEGK